jgi:hypothetical protein
LAFKVNHHEEEESRKEKERGWCLREPTTKIEKAEKEKKGVGVSGEPPPRRSLR